MIDLDGVLNQYSGHYSEFVIPKPAVGVESFLEKLNADFIISVFTTRDCKLTEGWLKDNSLDKYISEVTNVKKPCFLYIDDRAICHRGNFELTIQQIKKFKTYWK